MKVSSKTEQRSRLADERFERAYIAMSIGCFGLAFVILTFVAAKLIVGDDFINAVLSFFGV